MSEPLVMVVTTSGVFCDKRSAPGFGLWGSLHAVAASSIANAATNPLRPTARAMRLPPEGSVLHIHVLRPRSPALSEKGEPPLRQSARGAQLRCACGGRALIIS